MRTSEPNSNMGDRSPAQKTPRPQRKNIRDATASSSGVLSLGEGGITSLCAFSEVVLIEWSCRDEEWIRFDSQKNNEFIIRRSGNRSFSKGSIAHVHLVAWLCSFSNYNEEDSGWAIDGWKYSLEDDGDQASITIHLDLSIRGIGTRMNRIGYSWIAFLKDA